MPTNQAAVAAAGKKQSISNVGIMFKIARSPLLVVTKDGRRPTLSDATQGNTVDWYIPVINAELILEEEILLREQS